MARQGRSSNPSTSGGARTGARRGNASCSSAPFSSSSYSRGNSNKQRRPRPASDGPKGLHHVYDFAQPSTSASSKQDQRARRALAGINSEDYAHLPSTAKPNQSRPSRADDHHDDDQDSDDSNDAPIGPNVFDSEHELNQPIEGSDEELDSDEAFGESDEEKFDAWTFGRRTRHNNKPDSDDEHQDQQEQQDDQRDDDERMMDHLSRILDASSSSQPGSDNEDQDSDHDAHNDQSSSKLARHIESFAAGSKRPTTTSASRSDNDEPSSKRTRRVLSERTEAVPETEFAPSTSSTLRLDDFMSPLSSNVDFADVRKSTKLLANTSRASTTAPVASKRRGGALSAPLPTVVQDRLHRQAAYSTTRDEVQGWQPTINRLRSAEHLSFPLQAPSKTAASTSGLVATFVPGNDMESSIAAILTAGGLTEAQLSKQEDLAMNKLDPAEARARRHELRRMRMLMFRAEQKAKRVSKIKSKAYRKIATSDKEKLKAQMAELDSHAEASEVDHEAGMQERLKAERDRARERATLKHNNTSKWAKNILASRHGEHTNEARMEVEAQLRRGAELRAKIDARELGSDVSSDEYSSDAAAEGAEEDVAKDAFDELETLERREQAKRRKDEQEFERVGGKNGVYNMKFMKDARERQYAAISGDVDDFVTQMQDLGGQHEVDSDEEDEGEVLIARKGAHQQEAQSKGNSVYVQGNKGRAMYGAGTASTTTSTTTRAKTAAVEDEAAAPSKAKSTPTSTPAKATGAGAGGVEIGGEATVTKSPAKPNKSALSKPRAEDADDNDDDDDESNPWLAVSSNGQTTRISRKNNTSSLSTTSTSAAAASKSALKASKASSKSTSSLAERRNDERVDLDIHSHLAQHSSDSDSDSDTGLPVAVVNRAKPGKGGAHITPIQQRALVSEAFAGDDVVASFQAEKAAAVEADEEKVVDTRLPGWGSWTGKGVKSRPASSTNSKYLKRTPGIKKEDRKDAQMSNVIISEKRDRKQDKFTLASLPYPYTSVAQYKAALALPLGKEWNTRIESQRLNMPRVTKKPGKLIAPVVRKF